MEVTVRIDNTGRTAGTLGWLAARARTIAVRDQANDNGRIALLLDAEGKKITTLATADADGVLGVVRDDDDGEYGQATTEVKCWTDAAWRVVMRLSETAKEHLREPAELADTLTVRCEPNHPDHVVRMLAPLSHTDLVARDALVDRLTELADA